MRTLNCVGRMSTTTRQAVLMTFLWMLLLMTTVSVGLASFPAAPSEVNTCDISEFRCPSKDGQGTLCLPMDRWCNGKDDCDNRVDEPRSCSSEYIHLLFFTLYSGTFAVPHFVRSFGHFYSPSCLLSVTMTTPSLSRSPHRLAPLFSSDRFLCCLSCS